MWISRNILKDKTAIAVLASQTKQVISEVERIGNGMALRVEVGAAAATTTVTNAITVILQTSMGNDVWVDCDTVSIDDNSEYYTILLNPNVAADQAFLPLGPLIRVVITTGVADITTIGYVMVAYESP
jgi:hypothetical protein